MGGRIVLDFMTLNLSLSKPRGGGSEQSRCNPKQSGGRKEGHNGFGVNGRKGGTAVGGSIPLEDPQTLALPKRSWPTQPLSSLWSPVHPSCYGNGQPEGGGETWSGAPPPFSSPTTSDPCPPTPPRPSRWAQEGGRREEGSEGQRGR